METISTTKRMRATYGNIVVEADINYTPNKIGSISNGQVRSLDGNNLGNFSVNNDFSLQLYTYGNADHTTVFNAIQQYIEEAKQLAPDSEADASAAEA